MKHVVSKLGYVEEGRHHDSHLDTGCLEGSHNGGPFCDEVGGGDEGRDYKGDRCEKPKHILQSNY